MEDEKFILLLEDGIYQLADDRDELTAAYKDLMVDFPADEIFVYRLGDKVKTNIEIVFDLPPTVETEVSETKDEEGNTLIDVVLKKTTETRVKSKEALLALFEEQGAIIGEGGHYRYKEGTPVFFNREMFEDCGQVVPSNKVWVWRPEWLEEVKIEEKE